MDGVKVSTGWRLSRAVFLGFIGFAAAFAVNTADAATTSSRHPRPQLALSGTPATRDVAGTPYSFTPTASNTGGRTLRFAITGRPSWASFSTRTGALSGTPQVANVGTYRNISIRATNGITTAYLAPFSIKVTSPPHQGPTISGTPATTVAAGTGYSFTPATTDPSGGSLTFSIQNTPSWANFNPLTGQLSGTPADADVGVYSNIVISVSDGTGSASLSAFSIVVTAVANNGTATLSWDAPTTNTDGSALTNLAGYRIHYGTDSNNLSQTAEVANAGLTTFTLSNLPSGTWFVAVSALNTDGAESSPSTVVNKTIQ